MQSDAEAKCKDFIGQPVMFELIEVRNYFVSFFCYLILLFLLFNTFLLSNLIQNIKLEDSSYYVKKKHTILFKKKITSM